MGQVLSFRKDRSCPTHSLHFLGLVTRRDRSAQALVSCCLIRSLTVNSSAEEANCLMFLDKMGYIHQKPIHEFFDSNGKIG